MRAYPCGPVQRNAITSAVAEAIATGAYLDDSPTTHTSLAACVVDGGDLRAFETTTGIPGSLVLLGDLAIGSRMTDMAEAREFAGAWIAAPKPNADLTRVPSAMILWMIDHAEQSWRQAFGGDLPAVVGAIRELHARQYTGAAPARAEWARVRSDALAATDAITDDRRRDVHVLAETLAWPPLTSRTILADGVRILASIAGTAVRIKAPMSETERAEIHRAMESLYAETEAEREADPDAYFFPDIFKARRPEMSKRFETDLAQQNAAFTRTIIAAGDHALELIRKAPDAAAA